MSDITRPTTCLLSSCETECDLASLALEIADMLEMVPPKPPSTALIAAICLMDLRVDDFKSLIQFPTILGGPGRKHQVVSKSPFSA